MRFYLDSSLVGALRRWLGEADSDIDPVRDPIDHPDIAAMSLLELADLPLRAERRECGVSSSACSGIPRGRATSASGMSVRP